MAYESRYWRTILKRDLTYLLKKTDLSHEEVEKDLDRHFSLVEIKIMTTAYIIRKLADSRKIPDLTLNKLVKVKNFSPRSDENPRPYVDLFKEYDLGNFSYKKITIRELCNQVIHSYVLQAIGDQRFAFTTFFVVSDRDSQSGLFEVSIKSFVEWGREVAEQYISKSEAKFDKVEGKWIYRNE